MTERVLITGVGGFSGRWLARRLRREPDVELFGLGTAAATTAEVDRYAVCDLTDAALVARVIDEMRPDVVYHLAARTTGTTADRLREVNVRGFVNLCDALRRLGERRGMPVRMLTVGSAAELGATGVTRLPVTEDAPCEPETAYGQSKLEVTQRALREPTRGPLRISVARTFNLVGPGMGPTLSLGHFAAQIAAFLRGETDGVRCGNLASRRDFVDVRDAAEMYVAICRRGRPGELYNVARGRSYAVGDLLRYMIAACGADVPIIPAETSRVGDLADVYGDPTKTLVETGARATTPIERSLDDVPAATSARAA